MKFEFNAFFKDVNPDGQGTACLDFHMEVTDVEFRDQIVQKIMKLLSEEPQVEKEEKPSALGFATGGEEEGD